MMKAIGFLLLFLIAFAVTVVWKFPAAGVLPHVSTHPIVVAGVSGSIWNGKAEQVQPPNPTLVANNVKWRFLPQALVAGNTAANLDFEVLGGSGSGNVARNISTGNVEVTDGTFRIAAANLNQFLPLPVVEFDGTVNAAVDTLLLENNLLKSTQGQVIWRNAAFTGVVQGKLGKVVVDVEPHQSDGRPAHIATLSNSDGDVELSGEVQIDINGNYRADIKLKPTATANQGLVGALGALGPAAQRGSDGSYRIRNNGNIRNLM